MLSAFIGFERVSIRTDSQYLIKSVTDWIFKWLSNGWHKADGTPLKHKNYYRQLLREMEGVDVEWVETIKFAFGHLIQDFNSS